MKSGQVLVLGLFTWENVIILLYFPFFREIHHIFTIIYYLLNIRHLLLRM